MKKRFHSFMWTAIGAFFALTTQLSAQSITVTLPSMTLDPSQIGATVTVPITISDVTGKNITGFNFFLPYDSNVLEYTGYDDAGTVANGLSIFALDSAKTRLGFAGAGANAMTGGGTLIKLQFKVKALGSAPLVFRDFKLNDVITPIMIAGKIKVGNVAPVLQTLAPVNATEKDTVRFTAVGTDADNDSLTYTITGAPAGASINAKTGVFTWVPAYGTKGTYTVTVKAADPLGLSDTKTVTITIAKKNVRPYFAAITSKTVTERDTLRFTIAASDSNNDALIYSLKTLPVKAAFDTTTGAFFWVPDTGTSGTYQMTAVVRDVDNATDTARFTITVARKNFKPVIQKVSAQSVTEGDTLRFTIFGSDAYGEKVTYTATSLPAGAKLDTITGGFVWAPAVGAAGKYAVLFKASDPTGLFDTTTVFITVTAKNQKPAVIAKFPADTTKLLLNQPITFRLTVKDPNATDTIRYTWKLNGAVVKPLGRDSSYTATFSTSGTYVVTVVFSDQGGLQDSVKWVVLSVTTGVKSETAAAPKEYELAQNYPNPFNPSTTISFALPKASAVTVEIFNIVGARIRTLIRGQVMNAALHSVVWDGKNDNGEQMPSGMYLYRISAGSFTATRKMAMLK
ncbi:MAG: putative Ig domain-containing protein [Acidobacteriota bacterium]